MAPYVEDSFLSALFDPATTAVPSDSTGVGSDLVGGGNDFSLSFLHSASNNANSIASSAVAPCLLRASTGANNGTSNVAGSNFIDWAELPSDVVESLVNYLSSNDDEATFSSFSSPASSPDSASSSSVFGASSPTSTLNNEWWTNGGAFPSSFESTDNFGVVPTSAFALAHATQQPLQQQQQSGIMRPAAASTVAPLLQVPQFTQPPLPLIQDLSPEMTCCEDTEDMPVVEPLSGKRVSFKLTPDSEAEIMSIKEFYARIRETDMCDKLLRKAHPVFATLDSAVGHFYILKDIRARKPPLISDEKFNCHTRRDAGDAHWQYNVPNTDFTCRVTQWDSQSRFESATYTSYHYYRSPTPRRGVGKTSRFSPY